MWLTEDTDAALEWLELESSLCSGCGHPRDESFDPANAFNYHTTPMTCHACADRVRTAEARARNERADTSGEYYVVELQGD